MADFFSDAPKEDVEKPEEMKETLSDDSSDFEMDDWGNETFVDETTAGQSAENEMMPSPEEIAPEPAAAQQPAPTTPKTNIGYKDAIYILEVIEGFETSSELASKKNSKDGYMDAVVKAAAGFRATEVNILNDTWDTDTDAKLIFDAAQKLSAAAGNYTANKNPFFKKGQRRWDLVNQIYNGANYIVGNPDAFAVALKQRDALDRIGTEAEEGSEERNLAEDAEQIREDRESYANKRAEVFEDSEKYGIIADGTLARHGGSAAAGISLVGGLEGDALKETVTGIQSATQGDTTDKAASGRAIETLFDLFERENISDYITDSPAEIFKKDFRHKNAVTRMAFDLAQPTGERYMEYLNEHVPGLKYDKATAVDKITKAAVFETLNGVYEGLTTIVTLPGFQKAGPKFFNLMAMRVDDLEGLYKLVLGDKTKAQYYELVTDIMTLRSRMEEDGFRFGMSADELFAGQKQRMVEKYQKMKLL